MNGLGKIKEVELRRAWNHEANDFTEWLAKEENLSMLSDEIGISIKLIQTEASVGKFNVDILAEEENTGRKIIIENQLENTNHDHLGKIITYASGYDAEIVIWVVKDVRDEHKQAIDWLNENSDEKINFFIIKMELWQIGNSPYAPKFQIISQPNEWAKILKTSAGQGELTQTKISQLEFWKGLSEIYKNKSKFIKFQKPKPRHWYNITIGSSGAHIALTLNTRDNLIGCELYINDSKELFDYLSGQKKKIEDEIDLNLDWRRLDSKKASSIIIKKNADLNNTNDWPKYYSWMYENIEKFYKVFSNRTKKFN